MKYKVTVYALGRNESRETAIDYGTYSDKFEATRAFVSALALDENDYWVSINSIEITVL